MLIKKGVLYAKKIWAGRNGPVERKSPGGIFRGGCVPLHGGNGGGAAKRELLGGESDARSIAQRLAEGRTQAARDNAARPAKAAVKESRHDR